MELQHESFISQTHFLFMTQTCRRVQRSQQSESVDVFQIGWTVVVDTA